MKKAVIKPIVPDKVKDHEEAEAEPKEVMKAEIRPRQPTLAKAEEKVKMLDSKPRTVTGHVRDPSRPACAWRQRVRQSRTRRRTIRFRGHRP
jgi:hypothetical protein